MYSPTLREEELKNKVRQDFFAAYNATEQIGNIDFAVCRQTEEPELFDPEYFLWAEAKKGVRADIAPLIAQLVLTIGKARTFNSFLPPLFLGAFDAEKIAFVPYLAVSDIFYQNDFNWNVTPSDCTTREFSLVLDRVRQQLAQRDNLWIYYWQKDEKELRRFIKLNFVISRGRVNKVRITPNNFAAIFNRWSEQVAPTIAVDWERYKKDYGIIQADFFLADIFSKDNESLADSLKVLLNRTEYRLTEQIQGRIFQETFTFRDSQQAHLTFWNRYERPPKRTYWNELITRRDLLVPPDVRERKGAYFTPSQWVDLSQQYLAEYLGEDWQKHYYIWDCCAGTGNLLHGLYNKYNIYASTLDDADVRVMKTQKNLLESHVFQFDFLNDDLQSEKVPASLREIINDEEKRKKLVIYINPPYKEAATARQKTGTGANIKDVARGNKVAEKYATVIGPAINELFAQFLIKIYSELPTTVLAEFSTLKILQAPNFRQFRQQFRAKLGRLFLVPANTFDNVKGQFPIGFHIWDINGKDTFTAIDAEVFNSKGEFLTKKHIEAPIEKRLLMDWLKTQHDKTNERISYLRMSGSDFQHNNEVYLTVTPSAADISQRKTCNVTRLNVIPLTVYFAVRLCIPATWLNDRDQFLFPNESWKADNEFQSDCLVFTLFHGQNRISASGGTNHWIPFTEEEVGAKERFDSHFMSDFIAGKEVRHPCRAPQQQDLFGHGEDVCAAGMPHLLAFSPEARAVMDCGRSLWQYYHQQPNANPNASFYDIRRHFQGMKTTPGGKAMMNATSTDETYNALLANLRAAMKHLAQKIEPKVYEHGFLHK